MSISVVAVLIVWAMAIIVLTRSSDWHTTTWGMMALLLGGLGYLALRSEVLRRQLDSRSETLRRQLDDLNRLQAAYDRLDQQAKLVIHADKALLQRIDKSSVALHRTQEELDRRIASLMSLHELGQQLEVNLRPEEVFGKLDARLVTNFGFSKGLLGICTSVNSLQWRSLIGVSPDEAEALQAHLTGGLLLKQILANPKPKLLSATTTRDPVQRRLLTLLGIPTVVVSGVTPHPGPSGCLLLGRGESGLSSHKADEELVAILTKQLATAIENSKLFEETWTVQQELERKVQQRTHELSEANAKLVQLNNAKTDFVSAVSHELRTPLAAIKGYAALLAGGQFGPLSKSQRERIAKVERHSDALTQLINDLLDIARIESGRTAMEQQTIPVDEFLAGIYDLVQPQLTAKHLRYHVDRDGVTYLQGDTQQLQRVFVNLLSNAIKYTPEQGSIDVGLRREGASIFATVSDTGCGIAPEDLPKLFQEFYRSSDPVNQQVRGTGLGLALVKRIVEAHHGKISISSKKGKGSAFTVCLPAA